MKSLYALGLSAAAVLVSVSIFLVPFVVAGGGPCMSQQPITGFQLSTSMTFEASGSAAVRPAIGPRQLSLERNPIKFATGKLGEYTVGANKTVVLGGFVQVQEGEHRSVRLLKRSSEQCPASFLGSGTEPVSTSTPLNRERRSI